MRHHCYTAQNISDLWLSPYAKVAMKGGEVLFTQLLFRTTIRLEGQSEDLSKCVRLLEKGIGRDALEEWGKTRFHAFSEWVARAMRAGVIE